MSETCLTLFTKPTIHWFTQTFGEPTKVQQEAWPAIAAGKPVLVSAPTGTGKTLSAFLVFIDKLQKLASQKSLKRELYVIYVSPLKSLAGDIRENLRRPLEGIAAMEGGQGACSISVGIRTGDTPQKDRQRMVKHPPHILIITPESLYLMLTSRTGQSILRTARALIIDELHALIDTKRGAHLMLSVARLDKLCGYPLQRIGLSATIEPLTLAAQYLSPEPAVIAAPVMHKAVQIEVSGLTPSGKRRKDPVWEDLAKEVYSKCLKCRSVIAFSEGRRYAEKLAYFVNELGGQDFARVHHGSLSKEQRMQTEEALRDGSLRLLCATSSMELGIDVGEIDQVLQIGCPRTISGTMQRLGRAGHNPGRVSVMYMYPRTAPEALFCGLTAYVASKGGVEQAKPPRLCLDVLAQHLVSMAGVEQENGIAYTVNEVMELLARTYSFRDITHKEVKALLAMLAGDYEHSREIPVRPRVLYDRLHDCVMADSYSRLLAVAAGGTIPDKGMYTAKTQEGVKVGELDEEFVYESHLGDKFILGAFAWKIVGQNKDTVLVTQTDIHGARLPFWKGELKGRPLEASLTFGRLLGQLGKAMDQGNLKEELQLLGMNEAAREMVSEFLERQVKAVGVLPDNRTIIIEHFMDSSGCHQAMVHALLGRQVNTPLALLVQHAAHETMGCNIGCVEEEEGFLLYPYGKEPVPEGLLFQINPETIGSILEAILPVTPVFGMTFRYNAARALMMGMKQHGRQPLWMQRLRSTQMLDSLIQDKNHPLIRETKRECLEDQWDLEGVLRILQDIRCGQISVREVYTEVASPMSLPMQWRVEDAQMYEYNPVTAGIRQNVLEELKQANQIKPSTQALQSTQEIHKKPKNSHQLHSLLMIEGDITAAELKELMTDKDPAGVLEEKNSDKGEEMVLQWLKELSENKLVRYQEPGLWIAAEQQEEYEKAWNGNDLQAGMHIIRRMLYYRGPQTARQIQERYLPEYTDMEHLIKNLIDEEQIVAEQELYYHSKHYHRARTATIHAMRQQAVTQPPQHYAAYMAEQVLQNAPPAQQLQQAVESLCGQSYPVSIWETILLSRRVKGYTEAMLDRLLAEGDFYWKIDADKNLAFYSYEAIDWEAEPERLFLQESDKGMTDKDTEQMVITQEEGIVYAELHRRGASFIKAMSKLPIEGEVREQLLSLAGKGLVCADSFVPVRQWLHYDKQKKATLRQRVNIRVTALSAGRWDVIHPQILPNMEEFLEILLRENKILCRETFRHSLSVYSFWGKEKRPDWGQALEILRIWEFTGRVRRGYFVQGLSGAQFVLREDYEGILRALSVPQEQILWLNAVDPAQIWGKVLEHLEGRSFLNVPGTAVGLNTGLVVAVLERQGKVLRIFEYSQLEAVLTEFVKSFQEKVIFSDRKRIVLKEYPKDAAEALKQAGFAKEMQDFVLYR